MADNYLEYHREEYELRKARWLAKKKHKTTPRKATSTLSNRTIQRPEDEAL